MRTTQLLFALAASLVSVNAHIALWDEGMYGFDPADPNQSEPVLPLMHLPFSQWWFHGYINRPPQEGKIMNLPSGGTYHGQVACNKALTKYGQNDYQQTGIYACEGDDNALGGIGAMHTTDQWGSPEPKNVKGCGISIAYESDVSKIKPEDFTVISTNYTCPWFKNVDFHIPSDLPPCPEGGCHCLWGWIHSEDSGSEQNYHLGYRCNITGATGVTPLPAPKTANKCDYPTDTSNCTVGAKQPHYWYQSERNNNPQGEYDPPFYNNEYGYINGAQTDLFASVGGAEVAPAPVQPSAEPLISSSPSSTIPATSAETSQAASGAYGDSQPTITSTSITDAEPSPSEVNESSTIQTIVTVQTTMVRPSATTSLEVQNAIATGKTCSVESKRGLERLRSSPELLKKHLERKERIRKRRVEKGIRDNLRKRS